MIYIIYENIKNIEMFELWLAHYSEKVRLEFVIYLQNKDNESELINEVFYDNYQHKIVHSLPENGVLLTENDFLYAYEKTSDKFKENDNVMRLTYNVGNQLYNNSILIGKVFYVPITDKLKYTTFEIPDFIMYKDATHTNYTIDGIKINGGSEISHNIVCLSMDVSKVASSTEFYENNIFYLSENELILNPNTNFMNNIYDKVAYNIICNKEKKYAIIWHSMCGYPTIRDYLCSIYGITDEELNTHKFQYNVYLQGFDIISFVRDPYYRFISVYFDKHVNKSSESYLNNPKYVDYIDKYKNDSLINLANYLITDKFDEYTDLLSSYYYNTYNLSYVLHHIEDGLVSILIPFLQKYHDNVTIIENINDFENYTPSYSDNINTNYKNYSVTDWLSYKDSHNNSFPNYLDVLDPELKALIYSIYQDDFKKYNYDK